MARALGARALIRSVRVSLRENVAVEDGKCPMAAHGQEVLAHTTTRRRVGSAPCQGLSYAPTFFGQSAHFRFHLTGIFPASFAHTPSS